MAITIGNVTPFESGTYLMSHAISHTVEAGDNKVLIFGCAQSDHDSTDKTLAYVLWNGVGLTKIVNLGGNHNGALYLWYLLDPQQGTYNVTTLWNSSVRLSAIIFTMLGVNLEDALRGYKTTSTSSTSISDTIASASGDLVISAIDVMTTKQTITVSGGQTSIGEVFSQLNNLDISYKAGETAATLGGSWSTSGIAHQILASFKPSISGIPGVKTINGVPMADIKTVNGISVENIKGVQGLTFAGEWLRKLDVIKKGGLWQPQNPGLVTI